MLSIIAIEQMITNPRTTGELKVILSGAVLFLFNLFPPTFYVSGYKNHTTKTYELVGKKRNCNALVQTPPYRHVGYIGL
jgi:hypothetical protein